MVPLALRDALYARFKEALGRGERRLAVPPARTKEERAYLADRLPRFDAVLAAAPSGVLETARLLFNHGLYFDCHELLEASWRGAQGGERLFLQGLIQAGAAYHKRELGSERGFSELAAKAREKLLTAPERYQPAARDFARKLGKTSAVMPEFSAPEGRCAGCGRPVAGGEAGCRRDFETLLARDYSDARFFRVHRLLVDVYALQHPDAYCASAKSLAAHLTGLCQLMEGSASKATGGQALRRWLDGRSTLVKPDLPEARGTLTVADVLGVTDPAAYSQAVERWAKSAWEAYVPLHGLAREWAAKATGR